MLIGHGADTVFRVDHAQLAFFSEEAYSAILIDLIKENKPEIVLAGATAIGRSFIPAVAITLNAGLTADCTALELREEDGALLQTRPAFGGNIIATIITPDVPIQMATVREGVMENVPLDTPFKGKIVEIPYASEKIDKLINIIEKHQEENKVKILNGGMPDLLIYRHKNNSVDEIKSSGPPLGAYVDYSYEKYSTEILLLEFFSIFAAEDASASVRL